MEEKKLFHKKCNTKETICAIDRNKIENEKKKNSKNNTNKETQKKEKLYTTNTKLLMNISIIYYICNILYNKYIVF